MTLPGMGSDPRDSRSPAAPPAEPGSGSSARRRWPWVAVIVLLALAVTMGVLAAQARTAYSELSAARDDLLLARTALDTDDTATAATHLDEAAAHASSAADATDGPLWKAAAAIPTLGDTPQAVTAVASALDQALTGLTDATGTLGSLDPDMLVDDTGTINLAALEGAAPALEQATSGITAARATLAAAPNRAAGGAVLPQVDEAATQLATELEDLEGTLDGATTAAQLAPPLLGADGPKRYFMAILNPNEARGTGGFLGTYAILRADQGRITVEEIGSNSDLPTLTQLPDAPEDLGADYLARYGDDPTLIANMNLSPHHPAAARNWLAAWQQKTGQQLDGAFSADVVALGALVTATGQEVPLPDGGSVNGEQLSQFALEGIYEKFPEVGDVPARKRYQEAVTGAAVGIITSSPQRAALARALGVALAERRIMLWSADEATQQRIVAAGVGGSLRSDEPHRVDFVVLNASGSKLDAFLERSLRYEVGRCIVPGTDLVESAVQVQVINDISSGQDIPEYMISLAERGPDGPINRTVAQLHLPVGAEVQQVLVDGEDSQFLEFTEQGRPAVVFDLALDPRKPRTVRVVFFEPASDTPGSAPAQPLGRVQRTELVDVGCPPGGWVDDPDLEESIDPQDDPEQSGEE